MKFINRLLISVVLIGVFASVQATPFYITAPDGTTGQTGLADQMGANWSATSDYFDTNVSGSLDFGDTVIDNGTGNINGLLVGGVPQVGAALDGMNNTWNLTFRYNDLFGVVIQNPDDQNIVTQYLSGHIEVYYNAPAVASGPDAGELLVMTLNILGSNAQIFNALFTAEVDFTGADVMAQNLFFFENGDNWYDLWLGGVLDPIDIIARIDTNLDGPLVGECAAAAACDWTRTSSLNGSVSFVPEPTIVLLLGSALTMMGFAGRGRKFNKS